MCFIASLLPTPREPECRNSQTPSFSSMLTSMKWLPEPSEPSCKRQLRRDGLGLLGAVQASSSAIRASVALE